MGVGDWVVIVRANVCVRVVVMDLRVMIVYPLPACRRVGNGAVQRVGMIVHPVMVIVRADVCVRGVRVHLTVVIVNPDVRVRVVVVHTRRKLRRHV